MRRTAVVALAVESAIVWHNLSVCAVVETQLRSSLQ